VLGWGFRTSCPKRGNFFENICSVVHLFNFFQSDPDFHVQNAITIPIKKRSGKIADRFSFSNRIPIFPEKSISDFILKIGSRLKKPDLKQLTVVNRKNKYRQTCLTFHDRIAIFSEKSISDFILKIDQRFSNFNRDHDPDQKTFQKNR
jgi:hypothetical protein